VYSRVFFAVYSRSVQSALQKNKRGKLWKRKWRILEGQRRRLAEKAKKNTDRRETRHDDDAKQGGARRQMQLERRPYFKIVKKSCHLGHIQDPHKQNLREAIRNCVDSYFTRVRMDCIGLMHLVKEMYRYVTHMETVEIPEEFFDTTFIRHLMLGTAKARRENEQCMSSTKPSRNSASRVLGTGVTGIFRTMGP